MIIVSRFLVPKGYVGITLYPLIILNESSLKTNKAIVNHETIHLVQQKELGVLGFYIWYVLEFFVKLFYYKDWNLAYRAISFEREAYACERDLKYLNNRKIWSFLKYIRGNEL